MSGDFRATYRLQLTPELGFRDDTAGEVPLGVGLRMQSGSFIADLRGVYAVPFDQDIEPGIDRFPARGELIVPSRSMKLLRRVA